MGDQIFGISPDRLQRPPRSSPLAWQMADTELCDACKRLQLSAEPILSFSLSLVLSLPPLDKLVLTYFIPTLLRPSSRFPQRNDEPLSRIPGLQKKRNFCGRVVLILQHRSAEVPSSAAEEQLRGEEKNGAKVTDVTRLCTVSYSCSLFVLPQLSATLSTLVSTV